MRLSLQLATDSDREFCESLNRENMSAYLAARNSIWDSNRYVQSWVEFENWLILESGVVVGLLRLFPALSALEVRDLQVLPARQGHGIGAWAIQQAKCQAVARGLFTLRLRVYEDNPAKSLYLRQGFTVEAVRDGVVHMVCTSPLDGSLQSPSC